MKLMVIDGNSILNRAYYGIRPLTTRDGLYTHAIFGFLTTLLRLEGEEYKRAKGHPQPPLDQWYNRKTIDLTCQREMDALLYSPGLVEELLDAFEELLPYYHYFTALCSRGE